MVEKYANPRNFENLSERLLPFFAFVTLLLFSIGLYFALFNSPPDYQQKDTVRIMYVHVPAAWYGMGIFLGMGINSFFVIWRRHHLANIAAKAMAPIGAVFTLICLITGSLWGKPTWGTYWQWDGRMTSVLVLFFIYLAYLFVWNVIENRQSASRMAAILAMVGFINIPIIKFSVEWWNSLHQPATISNIGAPGLPPEMAWPLALMTVAYTSLFGWLSVVSVQKDILSKQSSREPQHPRSRAHLETL